MASAAGQRTAGKQAEKNITAVVQDDPELYDSGDQEIKDDRPRVTGKAAPNVQLEEDDAEELEAAQELDADKDALAADKEADVGDADAGAIDAQPEGDVDVKETNYNNM